MARIQVRSNRNKGYFLLMDCGYSIHIGKIIVIYAEIFSILIEC